MTRTSLRAVATLVACAAVVGCGSRLQQADGGGFDAAAGSFDAAAGDAAETAETARGPCEEGWTLCCGHCLGPLAGICLMPCPTDGGEADGTPDANGVACSGDTVCGAEEYCVSVGGGPMLRCFPRSQDGTCPAGTSAGCSGDGVDDGCLEDRPPSCRALPTACTSADPCVCFCGLHAGPACAVTGRSVRCELA